ncbi:MAG: hypothetical protein ACE5DN_01205 [Flavobacteriales bacterium]
MLHEGEWTAGGKKSSAPVGFEHVLALEFLFLTTEMACKAIAFGLKGADYQQQHNKHYGEQDQDHYLCLNINFNMQRYKHHRQMQIFYR